MTIAALPVESAPWEAQVRPARTAAAALHALSVDVEEYFDAEVFHGRLDPAARGRLPRRLPGALLQIADLLTASESRATFFVLASRVRSVAQLLRELANQGHEIACHGFAHEHLARCTPAEFREDLRRARGELEDVLGVRPKGYRAPTFSVTRATAWALDVLIEEGFQYDSSVFPIRHDRYGVPDAPATPFWAVGPGGGRILEFPPLTVGCGPVRAPVGGGGYLRLLPGWVVRGAVQRAGARGQATMLYVHPWELDAGQPRLPLPWWSQVRHRLNLAGTREKLGGLLRSVRFETAERVLRTVQGAGELREYRMS